MKFSIYASVLAFGLLLCPARTSRCDITLPAPPRTTGPSRLAVPGHLTERTVFERTLPRIAANRGPAAAMQRVVTDPLQRSRAIGYLAEEDFVLRNPAWTKVAKPNAPQNDVFTFVRGRFQGGQLKIHASGDAAQYMRDMLKDHRAEHFLVPDDHYPAVRRGIEKRIGLLNRSGDVKAAAEWNRHLRRLKPLGRSYKQLEVSVISHAGKVVRAGKVVPKAQAVLGAGGYFAIALAVEGGVVIYRSATGELTSTQADLAAREGVVKAGTVGLVTGGAILAGANPLGITVIVVGTVTYFIVDYAVATARSNYWTSPMTVAEIESLMPPGWRLQDPLARPK